MRIAGVVAEFNPFHNGHAHLLASARTECEYVLCVMSGAFVQRGEVALADKWSRARAALQNGADAVIELPAAYVLASADFFARGALYLLSALGCTDLFFGSECANLPMLEKLACLSLNEPPEYAALLHEGLARGLSHASARTRAAESMLGGLSRTFGTPNDILGTEYIKAICRLSANMRVHAVARTISSASDGTKRFRTARALREALKTAPVDTLSDFMPVGALAPEIQKGRAPMYTDALGPILLHTMRTCVLEDLPDMGEGLENRMRAAAEAAGDYKDFIRRASTRRYPTARLRRAACCALLGIPADLRTKPPKYARLLGFRSDARPLLAHLQKSSHIPVLARARDLPDTLARHIDTRAVDMQMLCAPNASERYAKQDFTHPLVLV